MTAVILSHIFALGYGWFFVDALMVMLLAVIYLSLGCRLSHWGTEGLWRNLGMPGHPSDRCAYV